MATKTRLAVITGGSGLLGRAIALELGRRGDSVVVHYHRSGRQAAEVVRAIVAGGGRARAVEADLCNVHGARQLLEGIDRLPLLIHAMGAYRRAPLADTTDEMLDEMLALNLVAPLRVTREALPALRAAHGQVIHLLDIAATQPWHDHAAYSASKAAAHQLTRCLALELSPDVRVNAVAPGLVAGATGVDGKTFRLLEGRIPQGSAATPQEVAETVALLADSPPSITGQTIAVDGGRSLGRR